MKNEISEHELEERRRRIAERSRLADDEEMEFGGIMPNACDSRSTSRYEIESRLLANLGVPPEQILDENDGDPEAAAREIVVAYDECDFQVPVNFDGEPLDLYKYALVYYKRIAEERREQAELGAIMTATEASEEFGITRDAVHKAIQADRLPARQSAATWLIRREDAIRLWGRATSLITIALGLTWALWTLMQ